MRIIDPHQGENESQTIPDVRPARVTRDDGERSLKNAGYQRDGSAYGDQPFAPLTPKGDTSHSTSRVLISLPLSYWSASHSPKARVKDKQFLFVTWRGRLIPFKVFAQALAVSSSSASPREAPTH
jgi:hypothetical protein